MQVLPGALPTQLIFRVKIPMGLGLHSLLGGWQSLELWLARPMDRCSPVPWHRGGTVKAARSQIARQPCAGPQLQGWLPPVCREKGTVWGRRKMKAGDGRGMGSMP